MVFGKHFVIEELKIIEIWYVYLVRTLHNKLYCGISNDPVARFYKHCSGKGAKFFLTSRPVALVYMEACASKSAALKREYEIKQYSKNKKEQLISNDSSCYRLPLEYADDALLTLAQVIA